MARNHYDQIARERTLSDAYFLQGGADYVPVSDGRLSLRVTEEQVEQAQAEMELEFCQREIRALAEKHPIAAIVTAAKELWVKMQEDDEKLREAFAEQEISLKNATKSELQALGVRKNVSGFFTRD
jgi:hypothetical protein